MRRGWNRRQVLAGLGLSAIAAGGRREATALAAGGPNERLNLAIIGCGGQGAANLGRWRARTSSRSATSTTNAPPTPSSGSRRPRRFRDYRKMLDAMHGQVDAVVVSMPDHMHAPISLAAMELGKHVYCEKPLTWGIEEARRMARVARQKKLATQMGTQGMAGDGIRPASRSSARACSARSRSCTSGPIARPAGGRRGSIGPRDSPPVPAEPGLGPLARRGPEAAVQPAYCPFVWRGWKDFGTGAVGDMGIHNAAMPFAAPGARPAARRRSSSPRRAEARDLPGLVAHEARVPGDRRPRTDHPALVRRRPETVRGAGRRPQARRQRRHRRRHEGDALLGGVDRRRLGAAARGAIPRLQAARAVAAAGPGAEPPPGMARRLPGRPAGLLPLRRLRRPA